MIGFQPEDLSSFGKIIDILITSGSTPLLAVQLYRTEGINPHIGAYQINPTNDKSIVILSTLANKQTYYAHSYIGDGNVYITMRSHVPKC